MIFGNANFVVIVYEITQNECACHRHESVHFLGRIDCFGQRNEIQLKESEKDSIY